MFKRITIAYSIINNRNRRVIPNIAPKLFSKRYYKDMSQRKVAVIVGAGPGTSEIEIDFASLNNFTNQYLW